MLLVKRPNDVELNLKNGKGKNVLNEYLNIVKSLNLIHDAKDQGVPYRTRAKFKLFPKSMKTTFGSVFLLAYSHHHLGGRNYFFILPQS